MLLIKQITPSNLFKIITEEFISNNPRGLQAVYENILNFIPKYCKSVREAVIGPKEENTQIPGFEFVVNAVWPEVINRILEDLTSIFNAGNPERFFEVSSSNFAIFFVKNFFFIRNILLVWISFLTLRSIVPLKNQLKNYAILLLFIHS